VKDVDKLLVQLNKLETVMLSTLDNVKAELNYELLRLGELLFQQKV